MLCSYQVSIKSEDLIIFSYINECANKDRIKKFLIFEKKYAKKVKVVLFINPGTLDKQGSNDSTHLGCQELREGLEKGFYDIQSHGENHKKLTKLTPQKLVNELLQAQTELRECTKGLDSEHNVASHLAYPYGAYNDQVKFYASKYYLSS